MFLFVEAEYEALVRMGKLPESLKVICPVEVNSRIAFSNAMVGDPFSYKIQEGECQGMLSYKWLLDSVSFFKCLDETIVMSSTTTQQE